MTDLIKRVTKRRKKYRKTAPPATAARGATPESVARALLRPRFQGMGAKIKKRTNHPGSGSDANVDWQKAPPAPALPQPKK